MTPKNWPSSAEEGITVWATRSHWWSRWRWQWSVRTSTGWVQGYAPNQDAAHTIARRFLLAGEREWWGPDA